MSELTPTTKGQRPIQTFRVGGVQAAIWENKAVQPDGKTVSQHSIKITRTYLAEKRAPGEANVYKETSSYFPMDLPKIVLVAQKAFEFITLTQRSPSDQSEPTPDAEDIPV